MFCDDSKVTQFGKKMGRGGKGKGGKKERGERRES